MLVREPAQQLPRRVLAEHQPGVKGINPNTGQSETTRRFLLDEMLARVKEAKLIGVDAIEFDDVDAYQSHSGLSISAATQLQYNAALANLAHRVGLVGGAEERPRSGRRHSSPTSTSGSRRSAGEFAECGAVQSWPSQYGKAVFDVEYESQPCCVLPAVQLAAVRLQLDPEDRRPVRSPVRALSLIER